MPAASSRSMSCQRFSFADPGNVAVRELVDEHDLRPAGDDRVDVDLVPDRAAVLDAPRRDDLEVADLRDRLAAGRG